MSLPRIPEDQLGLPLDSYRKGDAVEVAGDASSMWSMATVVRMNRARQVIIVTIIGDKRTRSFPPARVRRGVTTKPMTAEGRTSKHVRSVHVVTIGRVKVQTMADQTTRDSIRAIAARDGVTEGAVVRELLTLGFAAKGVRA